MPTKLLLIFTALVMGSIHFTASAEDTTGSARVSRVAFTTNIENREPVDDITELDTRQTKIFFFSELINMTGERVAHRWQYNGNLMAKTSFDISGPRWRVYSSKNLMPQWTGEWKVEVLDETGTVLAERTFNYTIAE